MKRNIEEAAATQHLTHDDVAHLVGDLDDSTIAAILATGATYTDIEQAVKWVGAGTEEPRLNSHGLTPIGELVCDILLTSGASDVDEDQSGARG